MIFKKGQIWVSVIIYTMVAILALVLILNTGVPLLTELKDRAVVDKVSDIMVNLDRHITEIANQGEGSQATVSFEIRDGEIKFENDQLVWEIETDSEIISPRSSTKLGNVIVSSNANVKTFDTTNYYILESTIKNDTFKAYFNKKNSKDSWGYINTSGVIYNLSFNGEAMSGDFTFNLNDDVTSFEGTGYTTMLPSGNNTNLGQAQVIAHMNTSFARYDLVFSLTSYSDFIKVNVKNIEINS